MCIISNGTLEPFGMIETFLKKNTLLLLNIDVVYVFAVGTHINTKTDFCINVGNGKLSIEQK